jgi:hypothetical protein
VKKDRDQRAAQELRDRLSQEAAAGWETLLRSPLGQRAVEEWARQHPEITPQSSPRFLIGIAFGSFVKRYVREHSPTSQAVGGA